MLKRQVHDLAYLAFDKLDSYGCLKHGISLRRQTFTEADFNFSSNSAEWAGQCRTRFCHSLSLQPENVRRVKQVHGAEVAVVEQNGVSLAEADGLCTDAAGTGIILLGADCPLIIVFDPQRPAVGLAHAGWRGTVQCVLRNLVRMMSARYGSDPGRLIAGIGPGICKDCFEVGPEVIAEAEKNLPFSEQVIIPPDERASHKAHFDLIEANRLELMACGLHEQNIEVSQYCTYQRTDLFYSYRREGETAGRWALLAGIV
jgi:hypothetical protein